MSRLDRKRPIEIKVEQSGSCTTICAVRVLRPDGSTYIVPQAYAPFKDTKYHFGDWPHLDITESQRIPAYTPVFSACMSMVDNSYATFLPMTESGFLVVADRSKDSSATLGLRFCHGSGGIWVYATEPGVYDWALFPDYRCVASGWSSCNCD